MKVVPRYGALLVWSTLLETWKRPTAEPGRGCKNQGMDESLDSSSASNQSRHADVAGPPALLPCRGSEISEPGSCSSHPGLPHPCVRKTSDTGVCAAARGRSYRSQHRNPVILCAGVDRISILVGTRACCQLAVCPGMTAFERNNTLPTVVADGAVAEDAVRSTRIMLPRRRPKKRSPSLALCLLTS